MRGHNILGPGHSNHEEDEEADRLASEDSAFDAIRSLALIGEGYRQEVT